LKDHPEEITISADDVDLIGCGDESCAAPQHCFNFLGTAGDDDEQAPTVAAIPFDQVIYIRS